MAAHLLYAETGTAKDGPAVPFDGSVAGVGTEVDDLALDGAAAVLSGLMVDSCVVAMGESVGKGALHSADNTAVMVGIAAAAVMLVGIASEGNDDIAPAIVLGRLNSIWTKAAAFKRNRRIHAHAACINQAGNRD